MHTEGESSCHNVDEAPNCHNLALCVSLADWRGGMLEWEWNCACVRLVLVVRLPQLNLSGFLINKEDVHCRPRFSFRQSVHLEIWRLAKKVHWKSIFIGNRHILYYYSQARPWHGMAQLYHNINFWKARKFHALFCQRRQEIFALTVWILVNCLNSHIFATLHMKGFLRITCVELWMCKMRKIPTIVEWTVGRGCWKGWGGGWGGCEGGCERPRNESPKA